MLLLVNHKLIELGLSSSKRSFKLFDKVVHRRNDSFYYKHEVVNLEILTLLHNK